MRVLRAGASLAAAHRVLRPLGADQLGRGGDARHRPRAVGAPHCPLADWTFEPRGLRLAPRGTQSRCACLQGAGPGGPRRHGGLRRPGNLLCRQGGQGGRRGRFARRVQGLHRHVPRIRGAHDKLGRGVGVDAEWHRTLPHGVLRNAASGGEAHAELWDGVACDSGRHLLLQAILAQDERAEPLVDHLHHPPDIRFVLGLGGGARGSELALPVG
mmetsp:Transcript_71252/g.206634  ORF Transcript_71252/g.206634 Transcript_71252/m.206634 type:complete len:214 (-) Transcript_71252:248-889(-)